MRDDVQWSQKQRNNDLTEDLDSLKKIENINKEHYKMLLVYCFTVSLFIIR